MMSLYPIGTAVKLTGIDTELVITGYARKDADSGAFYDYAGIHAAYGMSVSTDIIFFNEEHIEEILFRGYEDDDYADFRESFLEAARIGG